MKQKFTTNKIIMIILALALLIFPLVSGYYIRSIVTEIFIFGIFALSYNLLLGYTGIVSFGHALFFGGGAYITAILMKTYHFPFLITLLIGAVVCLLIGLAIGGLSIRAKEIYFSMLTMALGQFFYMIVLKATDFTGGDDGMHGINSVLAQNKTVFYYIILAFLIAVYILAKKLINSPTGKVLQAIRENEVRAGMIGYNVLNYKLIVIMISGVIAGIAGSLYVIFLGSTFPSLMHSDTTMKALFMTVLGGMGTLIGPILGSILIVLSEHYLSAVTQRWMLIFGAIYVLMILFFPGGIARIKDAIAGKIAKSKTKSTAEAEV